MDIRACGVQSEGEAYRCGLCGFTSDDLEDFATVMCWSCVMGGGGGFVPAAGKGA